jgi:hypothetical protein
MKALNVTENTVFVEISVEHLYTIFNSLNAVVKQYELLDFENLDRIVEDVDGVLEELTNMFLCITDDKGNLIPSR